MKTKMSAASRIIPSEKFTGKDVTKAQLMTFIGNTMYNAGLEVPEKVLKRQTKDDLLNMFNNMASLVSRRDMQSALGQSFYGKRDLYDVVGWKKELIFSDYLMMYERNGIAARVVDLLADETWRNFLVLHDGKTPEDYHDTTPFLADWERMVEDFDLPSVFNELDIALGISRFAVIVVGIQGAEGQEYSKPLEKDKEGRQISWLRVLDEGQVTMSEPDNNPFSPRYGLPARYGCQFEENGQSVPVHWTRVMHFKAGRGRSNTYGVPDLKSSFNYLQDLEKVTASSSEAFWQHIRRAIALIAREGFTLPNKGEPEYNTLEDQIDNWRHQIDLVLKLRNMDVEDLSSQAVDGKNQHGLLIENVAGTKGISQRILVGSEEAQLASVQDVLNLQNTVKARQKKKGSPWVKQFVKYMYNNKFIATPSSGHFTIEWLPLYDPTPMEKIDIALKEMEFIEKLTDGNVAEVQNIISIEDALDRAGLTNYGIMGKKKTGRQGNTRPVTPPKEGEGEAETGADETNAGLQDQNPNSQRVY